MFQKILVVCLGNICRSPIGEKLLQQHLPDKHIASAGLGTKKSGLLGKEADHSANQIAQEHGLSLKGHKAQQLTQSLCQHYDLILVIEKKHLESICHLAPEVRWKTMLFGQWLSQKEIPDPYMKSREAFEFAYRQLELASQAWANKIK